MEGKNIPPIITLSAAMIACVICILRHVTLFSTLKVVIGRIVQKVFIKINEDAEEAALQRQREAQELAAKELEAEEVLKKAEEVLEQEAEEQADSETSE